MTVAAHWRPRKPTGSEKLPGVEGDYRIVKPMRLSRSPTTPMPHKTDGWEVTRFRHGHHRYRHRRLPLPVTDAIP